MEAPMKINFKPLIESSEHLNLRIPGSLKKRMDNTRARAAKLGIDYNATLIANLEEFEKEFDAQVAAKEQTSATSAGSSLADLVAPEPAGNGRNAGRDNGGRTAPSSGDDIA
jgi:hypothetical protein